MNRETVARVFQMLSRAYPDYASRYLQGEEAVQTMRLYLRALEDVPDDVLEAATLDHIAQSAWWPKVSELRERCFRLVANEADLPDAYTAWGIVCRRLRERIPIYHNGRFHAPAPLHPLIEQAVRNLGGWGVLSASEEAVADRARFIDAYERLLSRERQRFMELPAVREARRALAECKQPKQIEENNGYGK